MLRLATLSLALLGAPLATAQTPVTAGAPLAGELDGESAVRYTLTLDADQFVAGTVDQHTVDVVVTVLAPDGDHVGTYDEPARGPEPFQFVGRGAGEYTIEVAPFEGAAGRYTLRVERVEPVATTPEGLVEQMMITRTGDVPGAVVGVVRDGELAYHRAFGLADLTHGLPYTADTPTNIGSTSKQFTAYAVALLAERGALSLDDDVREHVPELPDLGETVTLRHLLGHQSGYREFLNTLLIAGADMSATDIDDVIELVQRQPRLQNTPGAEWNYNNTGYALLAEVVARAGGAPFPEWMADNVFRPLGMTHTAVRATPGTIIPGHAQGYARGELAAWEEVQDFSGTAGAGGIYSTVRDLARWMAMLQTGGEHPGIVEQMMTEGTLTDGDDTNYGLGLILDEMGGHRRVHHGGADAAHRSAFALFPELDAGVIVLTNSSADVEGLAARTIRAFLPEAFEAPDAPEPADEAPETAAADFDDALFDDYAGRYAMDAMTSFVLEFRRDGEGGYLTQATGQGELEILPTSDSTFTLTAVEAGVTFHRDADGVVRSATLHQNGDHRASRLDIEPAAEARPLVLADFAGRYWSAELDAGYTLAVADGELVATRPRADDETLAHVRDDLFSFRPGITVTFERDAAGAVTAFVMDGGRTRDIRFDRMR